MASSLDVTDDRHACLARMIEHYRLEKKRRLLRLARRLWRRLEAQQVLADLDRPSERVH